MKTAYSQIHCTDKYSQHSSIIWPVWLNGWVFVYELSNCGFESRCSHLNYTHAQKVFEEFNLKNLGHYHDLYVQSDTLLLADVFENFRNKCIEMYELDPAHFLSSPGLAWQACLKKAGIRLELLTNVDMLLMVEKGIQGRNTSCNA